MLGTCNPVDGIILYPWGHQLLLDIWQRALAKALSAFSFLTSIPTTWWLMQFPTCTTPDGTKHPLKYVHMFPHACLVVVGARPQPESLVTPNGGLWGVGHGHETHSPSFLTVNPKTLRKKAGCPKCSKLGPTHPPTHGGYFAH